jgi:pyruvate formate lyase activating enzyme
MIEAAFWEALAGRAVRCHLCPVGCRLEVGDEGQCGSRRNEGGSMVPHQYGRVVSFAVDPIEKKPLYHFHPGREILSIAAAGCNLHCQFCQNWSLSQGRGLVARDASPREVVAAAAQQNSFGIAYTYSEPLVWYEFVRDTARLAREAGLKNVIVSNGYLNEDPLRELLPWIDAANIDLKSLDEAFYRRICKADLATVERSLALCRELGVHLEVTNLVIPGHNDGDDQLRRLVDHVAALGADVPLHFSAYHPAYHFDAPPTPPETLERAARIARETLSYVYLGNVHLPGAADTSCPSCGATVVQRTGYRTRSRLTPQSACPDCGHRLPFVLD